MAACGTGMPVRPGTALETANLSGWDQRLRVGQEFVLMLADLRNSSDEPITLERTSAIDIHTENRRQIALVATYPLGRVVNG